MWDVGVGCGLIVIEWLWVVSWIWVIGLELYEVCRLMVVENVFVFGVFYLVLRDVFVLVGFDVFD